MKFLMAIGAAAAARIGVSADPCSESVEAEWECTINMVASDPSSGCITRVELLNYYSGDFELASDEEAEIVEIFNAMDSTGDETVCEDEYVAWRNANAFE